MHLQNAKSSSSIIKKDNTVVDPFISIKWFDSVFWKMSVKTVFTVISGCVSFAESLWIMCFWPLNPSGGPELLLSATLRAKPLAAGSAVVPALSRWAWVQLSEPLARCTLFYMHFLCTFTVAHSEDSLSCHCGTSCMISIIRALKFLSRCRAPTAVNENWFDFDFKMSVLITLTWSRPKKYIFLFTSNISASTKV